MPYTYFSDNFENWTVHGGAWSSVSGENANQALNTSTDYARSGTKSLKLTDTDTTSTYGACLVENFSPDDYHAISTCVSMCILPTGYISTNTELQPQSVASLVRSQPEPDHVRPGATVMEEVGAWTMLSGPALSENAWHCIEMHVAPPSASTALQYWIDGTSTGTLTANYSPATSFSYMEFGDVIAAARAIMAPAHFTWTR